MLLGVRLRGHFRAAGVPIKRRCQEFKVTPDALLPVGTAITAAHFTPGQYVDVQGAYLLIFRGRGGTGAGVRAGMAVDQGYYASAKAAHDGAAIFGDNMRMIMI